MTESTLQDTLEYLRMSKKHTRAAVYIRVSDENINVDYDTSVEAPRNELKRYCALKGYELLDEHIFEEAKSAHFRTYRERPRFMKMLDICRHKEVDVVCVCEF